MNIEDLRETTRLAHLNMDDDALAAAFPAFEQMLGFFAAMQAADHDHAAFPFPPLETPDSPGSLTVTSNHFREDRGDTPFHPSPLKEQMLDNAGERDGGFVVIPNVL